MKAHSAMDRFVVRTKRLPRPERESTVTKDNKKQATIESLPVSFVRFYGIISNLALYQPY